MNTKEACIALNLIPKLGPIRLRRLLERFGSPQAVLAARGAELREVQGIGPELVEQIVRWEEHTDLDNELERMAEIGADVVLYDDPLYPPLLSQIHNPPLLLYVWGRLDERDHHSISVVGSRMTTHYGIESAKKLSYQLAYAGLSIVSGLAVGIDTAAHQGAVAAKGRTIAVLGSGLCHLYPEENLELAERIVENGAIVTEFPMLTPPDPRNFPQRNRIVSGWSQGLLVIEARLKSGALITADQAGEQGRSVYVVPGQIDRPTSAGSNRLIREGARLVTCAADILEEFQLSTPEPTLLEPTTRRVAPLSENEQAIFDAMDDSETGMDVIVEKSRLPAAVVSSTLLALEMKRLIKRLPGQQFVKLL